MKILPNSGLLLAIATVIFSFGAMPVSAQYFTGEIPDVVTVIGWEVTLPDGEFIKHTAVDGGEAKLRIKHEQLPYWVKFDLAVLEPTEGRLGLKVFQGTSRDGVTDPFFDDSPFAETSLKLAESSRLAIASDFDLEIRVNSLRKYSAEEFLNLTGNRVPTKKAVKSCCVICGATQICDCSVCASCGSCCQTGCHCQPCEN